MSKPATKAIRARLAQRGVPDANLDTWARFLTGLDWAVINPLTKMSIGSGVHPALAAGMTARTTRDDTTRDLIVCHLEAKAGGSGSTPEGQGTTPACPYCSLPEGYDACPVHRDGSGG